MSAVEQTKPCCTVCDAKKLCHVCGARTLMACSDCRINLGATVHVCGKRSCREAHDRLCSGEKQPRELGALGTFSRGKISQDDEGDIRLAVTHDSDGVVRIDFGKPVAWIGMPKSQAAELAKIILKHAEPK